MWKEVFTSLYPAGLDMELTDVILRLLCALILGAVIGTEREYTNRPAGMRTHMLVALGACVVMIISQLIYLQYSPSGVKADPARMGAQVISGIGFLGAGTILRDGLTVKGLTTAASLWATACLGLASGCGYYTVALCGTVFIMITLTTFEFIQHRLFRPRNLTEDYTLTTTDLCACLQAIRSCSAACNAEISDIRTQHHQGDGTSSVTFHVRFFGSGAKDNIPRLLADLTRLDFIVSAEAVGNLSGATLR